MNQTAEKQEDTGESGPNDLGDMIAELDDLRDRKRDLNAELDAVKERFNELEQSILDALDAQGIEMTRTNRASVSISTQIYPTVVDWEITQQYIRDNDALYLYQKRLGAGACQELWNAGEDIPGVEQHEKRGLNLRKIK